MGNTMTQTSTVAPTEIPVPDATTAVESARRRERLAQLMFIVPAVLVMLALFGYPIVKNVVMSLQAYDLRTFFTGEAPSA
jgi:multiple sugar transport system permease protein